MWGNKGNDHMYGQQGNDYAFGGKGLDNIWAVSAMHIHTFLTFGLLSLSIFSSPTNLTNAWLASLLLVLQDAGSDYINPQKGSDKVIVSGPGCFPHTIVNDKKDGLGPNKKVYDTSIAGWTKC